jgi:glutamate-5-semialdehyde dehydrogenase
MSEVLEIGVRARAASRKLAGVSSAVKARALEAMAAALQSRADEILDANTSDLERAEADAVAGALIDRLTLTPERIDAMADGLRVLIGLKDPIG